MADRIIKPDAGNQLVLQDEGGTASLTIATNGEATFEENIKISANKGIDFSDAQTSASEAGTGTTSSQLLNSYEEGTFTPSLPGSMSVSTGIQGFYTKIGRVVSVVINITNGTVENASSYTIGNLPFNNGGYRSTTSGVLYSNLFNEANPVLGRIDLGTNTINFATQGATSWGSGTFTNNSTVYFHFQGTYFTSY